MLVREAEAANSAAKPAGASSGGTTLVVDNTPPVSYDLSPEKMLSDTLLFIFFLGAMMYFIVIRPQQRRYKAHGQMLEGLQKGARVITGGGIIGTVVKLESNEVTVVEIAPNVKVRVNRDTIAEVLPAGAASSETANDN